MPSRTVPEAHERLDLSGPRRGIAIEHEFCAGLYARTTRIPAGTMLKGAIHREASFLVVRDGVFVMTTAEGPKALAAGQMFVAPRDSKRAGFAFTDVVITTFHPNRGDEADPTILWGKLTMPAPIDEANGLFKMLVDAELIK